MLEFLQRKLPYIKIRKSYFLFILIFFANWNFGVSQKMEELSDEIITDSIFTIVDDYAEFPGGTGYLMKFIQENLVYPEGYGEIDAIGKVYVKFVVSKSGMCSDFKILRGIQDSNLERAVIEMLKKMPKWKPAKINGKEVGSFYMLPVYIDYE
jgi:protein TonB